MKNNVSITIIFYIFIVAAIFAFFASSISEYAIKIVSGLLANMFWYRTGYQYFLYIFLLFLVGVSGIFREHLIASIVSIISALYLLYEALFKVILSICLSFYGMSMYVDPNYVLSFGFIAMLIFCIASCKLRISQFLTLLIGVTMSFVAVTPHILHLFFSLPRVPH